MLVTSIFSHFQMLSKGIFLRVRKSQVVWERVKLLKILLKKGENYGDLINFSPTPDLK